MKQTSNILTVFILTVVATFFIACDSGNDTTNGGATIVTPKAGSTYTYTRHQRDSTSGQAPQTKDDTVVATVVSSGTSFEGKSNVITLVEAGGDTIRYVMESNGDVSVYNQTFSYGGFSFTNPNPWVTFTFGSKNRNVQAFDTTQTVSFGSFTVPLTIVGTVNYLGTEELGHGGDTLASGGMAELVVKTTGVVIGDTITVTATRTISFDPSIGGYFHAVDNVIVPDIIVFGQTVVQGSASLKEKVLLDYTLIK